MDETIQLDPRVKISDLDMGSLPLCNFHIVVVVEPDPETWMMPEDDSNNLTEVLKLYSNMIIDDTIGEFEPGTVTVPYATDVAETIIILAGEYMLAVYFDEIEEYSDFIVNRNNYEFERLRILLDGISKNYPTWSRVAVVGGMYSDEIMRAANAIQAAGFDTTIVTRYCISEDVFLNLDDLFDKLNAERGKFLGGIWDDDIDDE